MQKTLKLNHKLLPFLTKPQPIKVAIGGRGCVGGETLLETPYGMVRIDEFNGGLIYAYTESGVKAVYAESPIKYPPEMLYKVTFSNGKSIRCTDEHRFLTDHGWISLSSLSQSRQALFSPCLLQTSSDICPLESREDVLHCSQILAGFLYCYFWYCRRYDQQLQLETNTFLDVAQQLADAQQHNCRALMHADGREFSYTHSFLQLSRLLSSLSALIHVAAQDYGAEESRNADKFSVRLLELSQVALLSHENNNPEKLAHKLSVFFLDLCKGWTFEDKTLQTICDTIRRNVDDGSYSDSLECGGSGDYITIDSVVETTTEHYYDLFVPLYNNYLSCGVVNHNSGKSIGIGDMLIFKMDTERCDVYCLREFQDSISDSVHRVFEGSINDRLKLTGWDVQNSKIVSPYGNCTTYKGANRNPDAMQSAQGYKYSWFEEAHRASQSSLDKLLPTILRNPGAQCWFTANPQSSADPFSMRFINPYLEILNRDGVYEDELHYITVVNWKDNPWWNDEQEKLRLWDYENISRAKYYWIWEGKFNDEVDRSIIKTEWFDAAIDAHKLERLKNVFKPNGLKIAAHDPSDGGSDAKGYALRHGSVFTRIAKMQGGEIDKGADWAIALAKSDGADWFTWDCDGMGAGLKRQVDQAFNGTRCQTRIFKGSLSGSGQDRAEEPYQDTKDAKGRRLTYSEVFKNNRAQYYKALADRFYNTYKCVVENQYIDPDTMISIDSEGVENMQELRSEVCRVPSKPNSNGLFQMMSKEDMIKEGIKSPNMTDAMMMSMIVPERERTTKKRDKTPSMSMV